MCLNGSSSNLKTEIHRQADMKRLTFPILVSLLLTGCGLLRPSREESQPLPPLEYYDMAWIDPVIVMAETEFTLLRADKVDSVLVRATNPSGHASAIRFRIDQPRCNAAVNIYDSRGQLTRPVLVATLAAGYYKLSLNQAAVFYQELPRGMYYLEATFCGSTATASFSTF
jgi:hypothetical protein